MKFNQNRKLDTSQIDDREGSGGGGPLSRIPGGGKVAAGGGAGILGLIIAVIVGLSGGKGGNSNLTEILSGLGGSSGASSTGDNTQIEQTCQTGADANEQEKCAIVADINSIQAFWVDELPKAAGIDYTESKTVLFSGATQSGCGTAQTGMGPFYCPLDKSVYLDRAFFDQFRQQFGAQMGTFAQAYVLAHEYGHHITDLEGNLSESQQDREGPQSGSVRVELQADCYAGVWAHNASATGFISTLTDQDIADGLDAAKKVGDDYIQKTTQGQINPESFTHGSSAQRMKWFKAGYTSGDHGACDTFGVATV